MSVRRINLDQFHAELKAQGVPRVHVAFRCPMCETPQSMDCLIRAGAPQDKVENYIGFSCVGRWTGAGSPRKKPDGKPCNWTLGGLFQCHKCVVVDEQQKDHPHFEPCTPEEAKKLMESKEVKP